MLIDFHTHVFPKSIAERALNGIVDATKQLYNIDQPKYFDGTICGLKQLMKKSGVDKSVVLPIATRTTQYKTINSYAHEISDDNVISFASLHPYQDNVKETIDSICNEGFKGIKLHPDYQNVYVDDELNIKLIKYATEKGLFVVIHSGEDLGKPKPFKCDIKRLKSVMNKVDDSHLIIAHMGGYNMWDDVEEMLVGTKAYFDTAIVSKYMSVEQYRRIIINHGADKILFGSDAPWEDPADTLEFLKNSNLSDEETELIMHKNAEKILFKNF